MFELPWYFGALLNSKVSAEIGVFAKAVIAGGMVYGCSRAAPYLLSPQRQRMLKAFRLAEICLKKKRFSIASGKPYEAITYPTIERICNTAGKSVISFRLPSGFNPSDLERKEFVFKQIFGPRARLTRNDDRFYQLVISDPLPFTIPFDYSVIESAFKRTRGLPVFSGIDQLGNPICYDMVKKPHLGIVGVTGYGKSSMLRMLLCSWLQFFSPNQLHLYLGDLKKTEFQQYIGVPHVQQVAVRRTEVTRMLLDVCTLLDVRSTQLAQVGARNIEQYRKLSGNDLPFIVVCIDEVALLSKEKHAHECLDDIGAIGRSLGVFLILSQQRADAEIIGGRLKNNLNVRIAYRMSDALNSRMFLENDSAAELTVPGRAIVKEPDRINEVQTPWLDEDEADQIIKKALPTKASIASNTLVQNGRQDNIIFGEMNT